MNPKLILFLALVLSGGLIGCASNHGVGTAPNRHPWISYNGKQLLFRNRLWDVESGREIRQFPVPPEITISNGVARGYGHLVAAAISPDGQKALTVTDQFLGPEMSGPGPVQLWDIASGRKLMEFKPDKPLSNAQFLLDGKRIVTTSDGQDCPIQIWDGETGQRLLALHERPVSLYAGQIANFSPDGRLLATAGEAGANGHYYGTINIRDSVTGQKICAFADTTNSFFDLARFSPDGKSILTDESIALRDVQGVVTNSQSVATIWDAKSGHRIRDFVQIHPLFFIPDGHTIICSGKNGMSLLDVKSGKEIRQFAIPKSFLISDSEWQADEIALRHDGKRLVVQYIAPTRSGTKIIVALWNINTGVFIKQLVNEDTMLYWQTVVGFSPEGENFMLIDKNGRPELFDGNTGRRLKVLENVQ